MTLVLGVNEFVIVVDSDSGSDDDTKLGMLFIYLFIYFAILVFKIHTKKFFGPVNEEPYEIIIVCPFQAVCLYIFQGVCRFIFRG